MRRDAPHCAISSTAGSVLGEPVGRDDGNCCMDACVEAAVQAIADAGVDKEAIDVVIPCGTVYSGSASSASLFKVAGSLDNSGIAKNVLHHRRVDNGRPGKQQEMGGAQPECDVSQAPDH